jgi:hypothetical protein
MRITRRGDIAVSAVLFAESVPGAAGGGDDLELLVDPTAGNSGGGGEVRAEHLRRQFGPHRVPDVAPAAVEGVAQVPGDVGHTLFLAQ